MALDNRQKLQLNEALKNAFNPAGFDLMLDQRVDKKRYNIVADDEFPIIVHEVIEAADREGWTANLIRGALEANPDNLQLREFVRANQEYNPSSPLQQRQDIADTLVETQRVLNEHLVLLQNNFQSVLEKIDTMSDYKVLHDELHNLIFAVFPTIVEAAHLLPDGKDAKSNLARYDKTLRTAIDKMREAAGRKKVDEEESEWIEELDRARKALKSVLDDFDRENLENALQEIQDVLDFQPTRINKELWRAMNSESDRLPELIVILEKVLVYLKKVEPESSKVKQFETGIESLRTLTAKLDALINEHDTWQEVVGQLFQIGEWIESDLSKFKTKWQKLRAKIAPFYCGKTDEETAVDLEKADTRLEEALQALGGEREEGRGVIPDVFTPAKAVTTLDRRLFEDYREKASWRFYDVDGSLLKRCEYLRDIRKQLP